MTLHVLAVDGSGGGAVPGVSGGTADPGIGPRWVAGGAALTWGKTSSGAVLPVGAIASIPAAGGVERTLATGKYTTNIDPDGGGLEPDEVVVVSGIGQGCGVSHGPLSSGTLAVGAGVGLAALVARRRRAARARTSSS